MGKRWLVVGAALAALSGTARAEEAGRSWGWGAVPVANYDADAGFGFGGIGTLELRTPGVEPYRARLALQLFVTSERVHGHEIGWDVLSVGSDRLRLFGRAGYFATVNRPYCGLGSAVTCAESDAEAAAREAGFAEGDRAWEDFLRRYHRRRFISPFGIAGARLDLDDQGRLSAFGLWRLSYYRTGTFSERGGYAGSLYARDFPDGEDGVASVPQLGVMYDTRDYEPAPSRGVFVEASVRIAHRATGSRWNFAGANASARLFASLHPRLVSATHLVADLSAGDLPVEEMAMVGAAELYPAFGGAAIGRGVRVARYLGRIKLMAQQELRFRLPHRFVAVGFVDAGWIGVDWGDIGGSPARILASGGAGVRWVHSASFILRADAGISPIEGWIPQLYLHLGHVF